MKKILTFLILCCVFTLPAQVLIFPVATPWKYLDNGSNQGTAWYAGGFNDAAWASGNAQLGYGDGDETTVVNACGTVTTFPTCTNKYITTYFRKSITVASASSYTSYTMSFKRDDALIVYFNGTEVYRDGLPAGTITYTTIAPTACSDDGNTTFSVTLSPTVITTGTNVIAVEIHQNGGTSSDITFEMSLTGNTASVTPAIVKGPYLQVGTQSSMMVRWESNVATDTKVLYGTNAASLTSVVSSTAPVTAHIAQISGLLPYTKYYYTIGSSSYTLQGDTNNYFLTSPVPGTPGKYRFWMVGDCGNASSNQINCKNQYLAYTGNTITNGMLLSGDNAYTNGTDAEYNSEFFQIYQPEAMKKMPLWPAPGNHDYNNGAATTATVPYFTYFSTPQNGEAGGVASNNPAYYSYDYGNIHFLSLDSYGTTGAAQKMYDTTGAQVTWIKQDLAANTKKWTIAYWHHPPYTMGSHNSDTESDLAAIRQNFIRILERNKVDMIVCGHSHDYERSKIMNGHYGNESTFNPSVHNLSSSSGKYDGSSNYCPYTKDSTQNKIGTVYVLSGSAGQLGGQQGSFPHDAMYYSNATNGGSFILDIEDNKLDAKWLCADGVIRDNFTIYKDVQSKKTQTIQPGQTTTLTASWPGSYIWSNAAVTRSISISALSDTTIWVKDPNSCVADTFKLKVLPAVSFTSAATALCTNSAIQLNDLSTNNTTAWTWSVTPSAGVSISNSTVKNPSVTFTSSGIYTITLSAANVNGPGTSFSRTLAINSQPTVQAAASASAICINQSLTLTASGASTYSWSTGATTASISVSPVSTSVYTLTGTNANGCKASVTRSVLVNALPTLTVSASPANATACNGSTLSLAASGASTYAWTSGITNATPFTATASTVYTVNGTDANGCQNTATQAVTVNALPTLTITASAAMVCNGSTLSLAASGASTYAWTSGIANATPFTATASTVYTVNGTDANGCNNTATQSITVNALPVVTGSMSSAAICAGQSATLGAGGATTYVWSTGAAGSSLQVTPNATTVYTVTGTALNSCQNKTTVTITVNALPNVSVASGTAAITLCTGSTLTLSGAGASTYAWSGGITNATAFTITANSNYTVTGTDANGCQSTAVQAVLVNPLPVITISGNATVCAGQTTTLTATGAVSYNWSNGNTGATLIFAPAAGYNYLVTGTDANGCKNHAGTNLVVNAPPNVTAASSNSIICTGQTATLSANGANAYSWNNNAITAAIAVSPSLTTTYTVSGNDVNGCANKATVTQTVSECTGLSIISASEGNVTVYPNPNAGAFTIEVGTTGNFSVNITNAIGELVYSGKLTTGSNSLTLNVKHGIYFYSVFNEKTIASSGKLIIE